MSLARLHIAFVVVALLSMAAGVTCTSNGTTDGTTDLSGLVITTDTHPAFNIKTDSPHGSLSCNDCHGQFDSFKTIMCTSCHSHDQASTDTNHSGVSSYTYVSEACLSCHPSGLANNITPAEHAAIFPIGTGAAHDGIACASCHPNSANKAIVDCVTCHISTTMATEHTQVGGYAHNTADCLDCHHSSQVDTVATHLPFLIKSGGGSKHYKENCRTCHNTNLTTKPFTATNFVYYSCLPCHNNNHTAHHNNDPLQCTSSGCHSDGTEND